MNHFFNLPALLIFGIISFGNARTVADFLIITQPAKLTIFNQYQQPLSPSEKTAFPANTPLQIVSADETLGDQITRVARVSFKRNLFFLQKDESGTFLGGSDKSLLQMYKNCVVLDDTVEVLTNNSVSFNNANTVKTGVGYLEKNETVVRVFEYNQQWYVFRTGDKGGFGWSRFVRTVSWRRTEKPAPAKQVMASDLRGRIVSKFESVNKTYTQYFEYFNRKTGQQKSVPVWTCDTRGDKIICVLSAPYNATDELRESTQALAHDLEGMLIGKQFAVVCTKGTIVISLGNNP